jgi:hypothetical protein
MMYGSMMNSLMAGSATPEPEVGMGATILMWSDRKAATITEVIRFKTGPKAGQIKAVKTRGVRAIRTDGNGMSDAQSYIYEEVPEWPESTWTLRQDGTFRKVGDKYTQLAIGFRDEYYDYSF